MAHTRYQVIFSGVIAEGSDPEATKRKFGAMFKLDPQRVMEYFTGSPVAVRTDVDRTTADKYLHALEKIGAVSMIEPMETLPSQGSLDGPQEAESFACPKCGVEQDRGIECIRCGIIIDKYLQKLEAQRSKEGGGDEADSRILDHRKPFREHLSGVFAYPVTGKGGILLIAGTLFLSLLAFMVLVALQSVFIIALIAIIFIFIFVGGFLSAFAVKVVRSSSDGEKEPPDWPSIVDFWSDIVTPLFQVLVTIAISFGPFLAYLYLALGGDMSWVPGLALALIAFGIVYFPMAFLAMSVSGSVEYTNPLFVISGIVKLGPTYLIACVVLCLVLVIEVVSRLVFGSLPLVGLIATQGIGLYFLMVECRIIGLLYFANMRRLHWFGET